MEKSSAFMPSIIEAKGNGIFLNVVMGALGVLSLVLLAQLAVPLPWTPVPITGQSFGIVLIALLFGQKRGSSIVGLYLLGGVMGLPFFALGQAGFSFGPTSGYLVGMFMAVAVVGRLIDSGWASSFAKAWIAGLLMTGIIFGFGLLWLAYFIPTEQLLMAGLVPFLPGAVIKITIAASISRAARG